jgi:hypothetical protein
MPDRRIGSDRRRRGRPPLAEGQATTDVVVALPASWYDRLYQAAIRDRVSVPEVIRRKLRSEFSDTKSEILVS